MFASKDSLLTRPSGGYTIGKSVRLRSSASAYLSRAFGTATNNLKWTWSAWVKRGALSANIGLLGASTDAFSTNWFEFYFGTNDTLKFDQRASSTANVNATTTAVFRDPSAWYHIVFVYDSPNATANNRTTLYVNGVLQALTYSVGPFAQNTASQLNGSGYLVGMSPSAVGYFDGYMTEINFIDGQALTPSSFGSTNATTGVWQPAKYTGTYGTNGFYLNFSSNGSSAALGTDFSGNSNTWTVNNISVTAGTTYDSMVDSPTVSATSSNYCVLNPLNPNKSTLSNCNLTASGSTDLPTIIPDSGTWYFEISGVSKNWTPPAAFPASAGDYNFGQRPFTNTATYPALNTYNLPTSTITNGAAYMAATTYTGTGSSLTVSNAVNGISFKPDWVWVKRRDGPQSHQLYDINRGVNQALYSNLTNAETTEANGLSAFTTSGFTVISDIGVNTSGGTYVGWNWKASNTTASNTNGSITSTVSAGATQGFSVATYTGNGSAGATFGHGLGVAPSFVIIKERGNVNGWLCYHISTGNTGYLELDATLSFQTLSTFLNNTTPSSSVVTLGTVSNVNRNGGTFVAYCFSAVAGYSAFGSYTGNGSGDGPFVYTGFRPRLMMWKRTDAVADWYMWDTTRDTYNGGGKVLWPNYSSAETDYGTGSSGLWDILSNGFKLRTNSVGMNTNGANMIYMAFAENPFKNSLAR
jgi:hypothetical protein